MSRLGRAVDSALEATVVLSWSNFGFAARRRFCAWHDVAPRAMDGRFALVTGATSGIGRETALTLARLGASVTVVGRDERRTATAAAEMADVSGGQVHGAAADVSCLRDVRELARHVCGRTDRLDVIVHAAGGVAHELRTTREGIESTAALHVAGPHLLTKLLVARLGPSGRVIWVSSGGMYAAALDVRRLDPLPEKYRGLKAYAITKRAQVELAALWDRLIGPGRRSLSVHPGWVGTGALEEGLPVFARVMSPLLRTAQEGADTIVWLATAPGSEIGDSGVWFDRRARPVHRFPFCVVTRGRTDQSQQLWNWCESVSGSWAGDTEDL